MNYPIITINELNNSPITHKDQTVILLGPDGEKTSYYRNCHAHREDGPAAIEDGKEIWALDGRRYSKDEHHAVLNKLTTHVTGEVEAYFVDGVYHREDGPAYTSKDYVRYYQHGKIHRLDGPAEITMSVGTFKRTITELWYRNGLLHRDGGPAVLGTDGEAWYQDSKRHREDGPAVIVKPGSEMANDLKMIGKSLTRWYLHDMEYTEERFLILTKKKNLIPLL